MTHTQTVTGNIFFVTGLANGREVFLGKAIDEPFQGQLSLEGKSMSLTAQGVMVVRPFATIVHLPWHNPDIPTQQITNPEAVTEALGILNTSLHQVCRSTHPLTWRWVETAVRRDPSPHSTAAHHRAGFCATNPFALFHEGFRSSAEQFRRAMFQAPHVTTTRELDKLTALEGDLTIEIGKMTNQVAIHFNQIIARETELATYLDSIEGTALPIPPGAQVGGWVFLINRLQIAKNWGRRHGKTPLVREINDSIKNGIINLNELILEHCSALDALITETFAQYGITYEILGELTPFTSYTAPYAGSVETFETAPAVQIPALAGFN